MSFGLRIRDPATGAILFDFPDSVTRKLGMVSTTSSSGSITEARFTSGEGTPWFCVIGDINFDNFGKEVSISGTTLSWTSSNFDADIIYGLRS